MHKKIIALFVGIGLLLAIAISLLTQQRDTYAWSSNNDYLDSDFWLNDRTGTTWEIINAVFGSVGDTDTYYTNYWTTNSCDPSSITVEYVPIWTDTIPFLLDANKIYVLEVGVYSTTAPIVFNGNCTAVIAKIYGNTSVDISYLQMTGWTDTFIMSGKSNNVIAGFYIDVTATRWINVTNTNNSSFLPANVRYSPNAMVFDGVSQVFIGWSIANAGTGLYINNGQNIKYGTTWPIALSRFSWTWLHIINTTNMTIDADITNNTNIGWYFENVNDITINSRYWTSNGWYGAYISWWNNINITWGVFNNNANHWLYLHNINGLSVGSVEASQNVWHGLWISESDNISATNITTNANTNNGKGVYISDSSNATLATITSNSNDGAGIHIDNYSSNVLLTDTKTSLNSNNGVHFSVVSDFVLSNYVSSGNEEDGVLIEGSFSGLAISWVVYENSAWVNIIGGSTGNTITDTISYRNAGWFWIAWSDTQYNTVQNATAYENSYVWFSLASTLSNTLQDIRAYDNSPYGIVLHASALNTVEHATAYNNSIGIEINGGSIQNSLSDISSFSNGQQGLHIFESDNNQIQYAWLYDNDVWVHINEAKRNMFDNVLSYDNTTAGIVVNWKGSNRNTINNFALFNNVYGITLYDAATWDAIQENAFNNGSLFNNIYGLHMQYSFGPAPIQQNIFNDLNIYNNDRWVYVTWSSVINNTYYGDLNLAGNTVNLYGTDAADGVLDSGSVSPLWLSWYPWSLYNTTGFIMTCNRAIQATNTIASNLLSYPYCDTKWPQSWTESVDVRYTFFPEIIKQAQPVAYDSAPSLVVSGAFESTMFVGDYVWSGISNFGGHIVLDEVNQFTYLSWWFTYRNYPWFDILMTINNNWPANYLITWVNNVTYDGVSSSIVWSLILFPTHVYNPFYLPLQDGLWITRVGYDTIWYESNYYGFIRWLNVDDDISIQKDANSGTVIVGTQMWFIITITNSGSANAWFSQVIDYIPDGIDTGTLVADPVGVYSGDVNAYIWDIPVVSWNTTYTFILTGTVLADYTGSQVVNTGYFISDQTSNGADWIIYDDASVDVLFPIDGVCWAAVYDTFYWENMVNQSTPSYLCSTWILTWFTGPINWIYEWYCNWSDGWSDAYCTVEESRCGDGKVSDDPMEFTYGTPSEQCDDENQNNDDGCDSMCQWESPTCTITAMSWYNVWDQTYFTMSRPSWAQLSGLDLWDGNTISGEVLMTANPHPYTYTTPWVYTATLYVQNTGNSGYTGYCDFQVEILWVCGNTIPEPGEECDDGNLDNGDGCSSQCELEAWSCTLTATPSIGLAPLDVTFNFQWSTWFVFDYINYGTWVTGNSLNYTYSTTGLYTVTAYQYNQRSWDVVSTCSAVVRANQLSCMSLWFSIIPTTGTVPFIVTGSYANIPTWFAATSLIWGDGNIVSNPLSGTNYGHTYTNTGFYTAQLHVQNTTYSWFDLYCPIGIGASACGDTWTIDIDTLEISVVKRVQNNGVTVFPNGLVPYIIEVTNTSTIARLDNVTIVDLISDSMEIASYFFEYNGTVYSGVVNDGYFVINNTLLPISLDPQETIEIVVYATIDPGQWLQWNNYAFAGGDRVPLNGASLCTSSGSTPTCSRNPNSPAVASINWWSSYNALINSVWFDPNNFTVCAETDQWTPTAPASMGIPLDPSVTIEKTLVDENGVPTNQAVVREDTTFILDIDFTNMYPYTINWNNFSLIDYFSGGVGISGWHIVDIQTASGVSVPRTTWSNEYNIDLSWLYAPGVYTPACQLFTWSSADHTPGCWTNQSFGSQQASYSSCLPQAATNSGYEYIQRYTVTGVGLNGIQFYPWVNDQWFGWSAVRSFFDTQDHTAMLCQTESVGIVIDQIDSLQLIITAQVTDPTLAEQGPVCNEANISYAGTGDIDDACFDLTIPQYCALMIQPDFVISTYDTVPYISWGYVQWSILSDMTLTSTTTSVNPIVSYQWDIYSSGDFFWMRVSPYIFDNNLIMSGQGTPAIDLNFMQYALDAAWPFIWVSLTVTDSMWYQAEYTTPLFRDHDQWWLYWIAGNTITWSNVTGYTFNITGEMLSSTTNPIIPSNELWSPDVGLVPTMAGIDRYNVGTNDEFFSYLGAYNYSNVYTPWVHTLNLNTHIGDINQNYPLGERTYPVACSVSCGNGVIEWIEQCDDTNTNPGDGCSNYCQIESWRQCTGQPSVCTIIPPYCGDGIPQNLSWSTTTGTIDYVIYGDISATTGNEVYGFMWYQTGGLFTFTGGINTGNIVSYQWALSWSDSMNPGITWFIVWSSTGAAVNIFSNAISVNGTNRQWHITLTMIDLDGNTIQVQWYINAYRDGMTVVYPSVNNITIAWSTVTYADYEVTIAWTTALFPPSLFVSNASTWWSLLFSNGWWAGYDWYNDGIYDYTQQWTWQVVQYAYNATGAYITTDITYFFSWFAMNVPADIGDLHTNYVFHTTAGQAISWYQEICDDGNQDDYDGCTTQCQLTSPQCQMILVHKIDPIINYVWSYPMWTGSTGIVLTFDTPTVADGYTYQWSVSWLDLNAVNNIQFLWSSIGTGASIFVSADTVSWWSSFPDFSFQVWLTISNGLMTGYVDGIASCTQNGACGFTTYSYNFATGNVQWFAVNGNYNSVTYMQSINTTTPPTPDSLTWITIQNGGWNYFLGIYDTGTYIRYTSPSNWSGYLLDSWATYDTIPFQLSGGWISFNNTIGVSYYNTCLGWSYCGDGIVDGSSGQTTWWYIQSISSIDIYAITWYANILTGIKQGEEFSYTWSYVYTFSANLTGWQTAASYNWTLNPYNWPISWSILWSSTGQNVQIFSEWLSGYQEWILNITIVTTSWYTVQTQAAVTLHQNGIEVVYLSADATIIWTNQLYYSNYLWNEAGMTSPQLAPSVFTIHSQEPRNWYVDFDWYDDGIFDAVSTTGISYLYNINTWSIVTNLVFPKPIIYQNHLITMGQWLLSYTNGEACDLWPLNGQPNSWCNNYCQITSVSCNIIWFPLWGNAPLTVNLAMNPLVPGSYFDYGNGTTGTLPIYTYATGGVFNIVWYTPHPTASWTMVACPLVSQITISGCPTGHNYCPTLEQCIPDTDDCPDCTTNNHCPVGEMCTQDGTCEPQVCWLSVNLVPNPSFESVAYCPSMHSQFADYVASWYAPGPDPDYAHLDCAYGTGLFDYAQQYPHTGSGAAHLLTYASNMPDGREYIGVELTVPMQVGKSYEVWFCYALSSKSNYITDKIGMLFSTGSYPVQTPAYSAITQVPQYEHTGYIGTWWECVTGTVYADQPYDRFLLGSFHSNAEQSMIPNPEYTANGLWYEVANYLIDDVFVSEIYTDCTSCTLPFVYSYTGWWNGVNGSELGFGLQIQQSSTLYTGEYHVVSYIYIGDQSLTLTGYQTWITRNTVLWAEDITIIWTTHSWVIGVYTGQSWWMIHYITWSAIQTGSYTVVTQVYQPVGGEDDGSVLCSNYVYTGTISPAPYCGDGIVNQSSEQCDGWSNCTSQCKIRWWGGGWSTTDYCPNGDFSSSYYDGQCGSAPVHGSAPVGKFCIYDDEEYLARGSFDDIFGHWGELPIEVMRVSCLHRGRHTKAGWRRYEPNANIQRDEVLKTLVKIVGIADEDFTIKSEELLYTGVIPFSDVAYNNWFSHYASYAFAKWLTQGLYTTTKEGKNQLSPTKNMTRYEATKAIVIAYEKIQKSSIAVPSGSVSKITDVKPSNPYYTYIRKAEIANLVQWYPQKNGTFVFRGDGFITRAEFAKIIASAFGEWLVDVDQVVSTSSAYAAFAKAIQTTKMDKLTFIKIMFEKLRQIDNDTFLRKFKVSKDVFLKTLSQKVLLPMIQK